MIQIRCVKNNEDLQNIQCWVIRIENHCINELLGAVYTTHPKH